MRFGEQTSGRQTDKIYNHFSTASNFQVLKIQKTVAWTNLFLMLFKIKIGQIVILLIIIMSNMKRMKF